MVQAIYETKPPPQVDNFRPSERWESVGEIQLPGVGNWKLEFNSQLPTVNFRGLEVGNLKLNFNSRLPTGLYRSSNNVTPRMWLGAIARPCPSSNVCTSKRRFGTIGGVFRDANIITPWRLFCFIARVSQSSNILTPRRL